jgi:hypothetical protein
MMEAFGLSIHGGTAGSSETWLASSSDQATSLFLFPGPGR